MTAAPVSQLMLEGQAAAPEGPLDLTPMFVMHRAFRRDVDLFAAAAAVTPVQDRGTWRRMAKRWQLFAGTLHKHHTAEDAVLWPMLEQYAQDDEAAVLAAMEAEHGVLDPLLGRVAADLEALAEAPNPAARDQLVRTLAEVQTALSAHLGHEETDAMAMVQRHLSQEEWHRLDDAAAEEYKPSEMVATVGWVMWQLPRAAAYRLPGFNRLMAGMGALAARLRRSADRRTFRYLGNTNPLLR